MNDGQHEVSRHWDLLETRKRDAFTAYTYAVVNRAVIPPRLVLRSIRQYDRGYVDERISVPLHTIRAYLEGTYDAPGVSDSGPVVGGDAPDGAAQPPVLPDGGAAQAERPHGS